MGDLGTSIILTMAPIFVLMIGLVVYGVMKNRNKVNSRSKRETDALIEAQAMLAKYQKEQAEKESKDEKKKENTPKPTADAPISDTTELEPDIDKTKNE